MLRWSMHVAVDDQDPSPARSPDGGQIAHGTGFTFGHPTTGHTETGCSTLPAKQIDVGLKDPVGLAIWQKFAVSGEPLDSFRNNPHHRNLQYPRDILHRLYTGVHVLKEEGQRNTKNQAGGDAQ